MYSVYYCLTNQHDWRFVLLAACVCAVASFTSFHIYGRITDGSPQSGNKMRRLVWLALTGISAGSGIWATHFVAMLAYDPGLPTAYAPFATAAAPYRGCHDEAFGLQRGVASMMPSSAG